MPIERVWLAKDDEGRIICVSRAFQEANNAMVCDPAEATTLRQVLLVEGEPEGVRKRAEEAGRQLDNDLWTHGSEFSLQDATQFMLDWMTAERALAQRDMARRIELAYHGAYLRGQADAARGVKVNDPWSDSVERREMEQHHEG